MTTTWTNLAQQHGAKAAVSLTMSDEELEAMTAHQSAILIDALRPLLRGDEHKALDFGCGSGRFCGMLYDLLLVPDPVIFGFDPCSEMLHCAKADPERPCILTTVPPHHIGGFDVVFLSVVLGDPEIRIGAAIFEALSLLAPGGLLVAIDHMPDTPPLNRWWRFRSQGFYQGLFRSYDVPMSFLTKMPQGQNEVTILAGRKKP
jgi:SAM-dependent methyltransferase